jgi:hypothetical protein
MAAVLVAMPATGTTIAPLSVTTMADHSGQVIAGDVLEVRSYWTGTPRRIESEVTFANVTYLKGALPTSGRVFTLTVPGGAVGDMEMRIEGAPRFEVGESWVLFLLPAYRTFPVVGLSQGAFRIVTGVDGVERVEQGGRFVTGFDEDGFVRVASRPETVDAGLSYADFADLIEPALRASRDHALIEPAGRPLAVRYTPVPLQGAGTSPARPRRTAPREKGNR